MAQEEVETSTFQNVPVIAYILISSTQESGPINEGITLDAKVAREWENQGSLYDPHIRKTKFFSVDEFRVAVSVADVAVVQHEQEVAQEAESNLKALQSLPADVKKALEELGVTFTEATQE